MANELEAQSARERDVSSPQVMRALVVGAILGTAFWAILAWFIAAII